MPAPDPLTPLSVGMAWAARVSSIALAFAIPPLLGWAVDRQLGSGPVGVLVGVALGFAVGMAQLLALARTAGGRGRGGPGRPTPP